MHLGIDLGTSAVKAVLTGMDGALLAQASAPVPSSFPRPLWSEQNPEEWWRATGQALAGLGTDLSHVRGIGLSGQMHGAVLLDGADRVLRPAILWNDGRCAAECDVLEAAGVRAATGNLAMPGFTAPKLLWVRHHEPNIFAATRRVLLPKDWLRLRMTGEAITDMSDAAGTLWLDVGARRWSEAMLAATGLSPTHMPALVEGTAPAGRLRAEVAAAWGLPAGIPIAGGAGDQAAGAAALGCVRPGQGFVALGTSAVLFVCDAGFLPDPDRTVHAFCHCVPGVWHRMTVSLSGASALAWITRATGAANEAALLAEMEHSTEPPPIFLPHLTGERTPHNDPGAEAAFVGLRAAHGRGDLARAVLEGVAFTLAEGMEVLAACGAPVAPLVAISGGARSPAWMRLVAAALDLPVATVHGGEVGSALGAARLARVAAGDGTAEEVFTPLPVAAVHEPDPRLQEALAPRRAVHRALYAALRPLRPAAGLAGS